MLRHLEDAGLPAVRAVGLAERPERGDAVLVTEYLRHSMQYRRLLMRLRGVSRAYRDRLLDAMALLLVDLHRGGVYWGDCSLANTLFRRDGDRIQAYLVDAETCEVHPELSDGQRRFDLDILVENVAFGLADLAAYQGRRGRRGRARSRRPSPSGRATTPSGRELPRPAGPHPGRPAGDPGAAAAPQRPRLLRGPRGGPGGAGGDRSACGRR